MWLCGLVFFWYLVLCVFVVFDVFLLLVEIDIRSGSGGCLLLF